MRTDSDENELNPPLIKAMKAERKKAYTQKKEPKYTDMPEKTNSEYAPFGK